MIIKLKYKKDYKESFYLSFDFFNALPSKVLRKVEFYIDAFDILWKALYNYEV